MAGRKRDIRPSTGSGWWSWRGVGVVSSRSLGRILLAPLAFACVAPAPERAPGQVPEWTLRRGLAIGSSDDPVYGLWAVGGVLVDRDHVYVL